MGTGVNLKQLWPRRSRDWRLVMKRRQVTRYEREPSRRAANRAEAVVIPTGHEHPAERAPALEQQADRPVHVTLPYCREDNTVVHHE